MEPPFHGIPISDRVPTYSPPPLLAVTAKGYTLRRKIFIRVGTPPPAKYITHGTGELCPKTRASFFLIVGSDLASVFLENVLENVLETRAFPDERMERVTRPSRCCS